MYLFSIKVILKCPYSPAVLGSKKVWKNGVSTASQGEDCEGDNTHLHA